MIAISLTEACKATHPQALIGILEVAQVDNTVACPELDQRKRVVEVALRQRYKGFERADFVATSVLCEYVRYYKLFEKTYHVQLQLESIVLKGKPLPNVSPLVDANFVSELETLVLTAAHDVANLRQPVCIDVSRTGDSIVQMNGAVKSMRAGDIVIRDAEGISCSIIYGQDNRSAISAHTTHALYVACAPPGVSEPAVQAQLEGVLNYIRTFAPNCVVKQQSVLRAR
jgi:DNA/RNA-binding domain of Phe-tRNA-synthetase-like protein